MGRLEKAMAGMPRPRRDSAALPGLRRTTSVVKRSSVVGGARRSSTLASEPAAIGQTGTPGAPQAQSVRPSITGVAAGAHQLYPVAAMQNDTCHPLPGGSGHCAGPNSIVKAVLMRALCPMQHSRAQPYPSKRCHHHQQRDLGPSQEFCWRKVPMACPHIRECPPSRMEESHRHAPARLQMCHLAAQFCSYVRNLDEKCLVCSCEAAAVHCRCKACSVQAPSWQGAHQRLSARTWVPSWAR